MNDLFDNVQELSPIVKEYFRDLLLSNLDLEQLEILSEIEKPKELNHHYGARGLYKDPVIMHRNRERQKVG